MIVRNSNSRRVSSSRALEPREFTPSTGGSRGEFHDAFGGHRLIGSEAQHEGFHNFTDQAGTVVLIGVTIPGLGGLGKIALPFIYRPFHSAASIQNGGKDNAARY